MYEMNRSVITPRPFAFPDLGDVQHALELVSKFDFDTRNHVEDEKLDLRGNPWVMPPEAVVEQGLEAIKIFLRDVQKASKDGAQVRSLKLLKVVLVGAASAGKTRCLDNLLFLNRWIDKLQERATSKIPWCAPIRGSSPLKFCVAPPYYHKALHPNLSVGLSPGT